MKEFQVKLLVEHEFEETQVVIQTADQNLGEELLNYINNFSRKPDELRLKTTDGIEIIPQKEIICLEVFQREITIYHTKGELSVRMPLAKIQEYLDEKMFQQVSKSTVINLLYLQKLEVAFSGNYYGYLANQKVVISRRYIKKLKENLDLIGGK